MRVCVRVCACVSVLLRPAVGVGDLKVGLVDFFHRKGLEPRPDRSQEGAHVVRRDLGTRASPNADQACNAQQAGGRTGLAHLGELCGVGPGVLEVAPHEPLLVVGGPHPAPHKRLIEIPAAFQVELRQSPALIEQAVWKVRDI